MEEDYEPGCIAAMMLLLRRTLVLQHILQHVLHSRHKILLFGMLHFL